MDNEGVEAMLVAKGIKPTANRILVMRELIKTTHPVSLADLEIALSPMDKASIFRVLELFAEKEIVHVLEDGSRSLKYELCHSDGEHSASDQHAHFYCVKCGSVYCLNDIVLPAVDIPDGYEVKSVNFMLKGVCANCKK
ncbi:MAG: transcriptional repressor [Bacteroides sp.]|nr:transcriptional repressor [Bacteroides sp.]